MLKNYFVAGQRSALVEAGLTKQANELPYPDGMGPQQGGEDGPPSHQAGTGPADPGQGEGADLQHMLQVLGSMDEGQLGQLLQSLPPEEQQQLIALLQHVEGGQGQGQGQGQAPEAPQAGQPPQFQPPTAG